jgi:5,10-methylenetetrahydromethanopterin reductase
VEVGLGLQTDKSPEEYESIVRRAEAAGLDVVSVYHDLLYPPAIFPLLVMARSSERIRLGPAALNPYTLHPVEIAGQTATLDRVSNGRAYVGIAQGAWLDRLGIAEQRRLTGLEEAVEIVRRLLRGDASGFSGKRFALAPGATLNYEPRRRDVPLSIGTWGTKTAALAGRLAQELKIGGTANPDVVPVMRERIGNDRVGVVVGAVTVVDEDGSAARERARAEVAMYLDVVAHLDPTLELRPGQKPPLSAFVFAGTPEEVAAHALRIFEAGAKRVEFGKPHGLTTDHGLELLCDRVLPLLRR